MKQTLAHILLFLGASVQLMAQTAMDTISLPEVVLEESRLQTHTISTVCTAANKIIPDAILQASSQRLSDVLTQYSSFYIKQYGALATPSFRGTSSEHTLVLWNGIPINSIANGLLDFSILPSNGFANVYLVHGGDASVFGSGAIGGSVHLNSTPSFKPTKELKLNTEQGSFGLASKGLSFKYANGKTSASGAFSSLTDANAFEYVNITQIGHPTVVNDYGKVKSQHQQFNLASKYNNNNQFSFSYWAAQNEREVPQNMTIPFSDAMQYDASKRILFSLKHKREHIGISLKQAYLLEDFRYTELKKGIDSKILAENYISDIDVKYYKENLLVNIGGILNAKKINTNNYKAKEQEEQTLAAFSALQYQAGIFQLGTVLRKEWQTAYKVPFMPTLSFTAAINDYLNLRLKYNRNFRTPTFNERYWIGAGTNGNPDLVPESAWNKEFGFDISSRFIKFSATAYNLDISDMILWQQLENGNWTTDNIKQVWSRGLEGKIKIKIKDLSIIGNYAYTKSTSEIPTDNLDESVGEQLRYVPLHKGNITFIITEDNLQLSLNQSYTGEVITSHGALENKTLDAFILTDIAVKYTVKGSPISITGQVKNLMNKSYTTYQNYPNPGRELLLTLNYTLN